MSQDPQDSPGGGSPHLVRKRQRRLRRILRTAAAVFAEHGYEGANLEKIAERLEMRGPSLYHYFPSKDALLLECLAHVADDVLARAREVAASQGSPRERLRRLFAQQVLVQVRDYPEFIPLFLGLRVPEGPVRDRIAELRREHGAIFRAVTEEAAAAGELTPEGHRLSLFLSYGAISYIQQWYHPDGPLAPEDLAEEVADRLMCLFST